MVILKGSLAEFDRKGDKLYSIKGLDYLITICEALDLVSQNIYSQGSENCS
jgi:hypothetical protein